MTATVQEIQAKKQSTEMTNSSGRWDWLLVLAFICLLQYVNFAQNARSLGFCVDEWELFGRLHFLPHSLFEYTQAVLLHPRLIVRPMLALIFGPAYFFFGDNPVGYHLMNQVVEVAGAQFLFLTLVRLTKQKLFSCVAAAIFLLYPNHDFTHYSVTAMVQNIALTLTIMSLWLISRKTEFKSWTDFAAPWLLMTLGILTYENCIPLISLHAVVLAWILLGRKATVSDTLLTIFKMELPLVASVFGFAYFRSVWLPAHGFSPIYKSGFDVNHAVKVFVEGMNVSFLAPAFQFFSNMTMSVVKEGLTGRDIFQLILVGVGFAALIAWFSARSQARLQLKNCLMPMFLGLITFAAAYSMYTMAPEYIPVLDSNFNRINSASSLGSAITVAALISMLAALIPSVIVQRIFVGVIAIPLLIFFTMTNWGFSRPWLAASSVQNHLTRYVRENADLINKYDSVVLVNTPRYVMWASLFDSVWDFESMLRIATNNKTIKGGVVSERMIMDDEKVTDMSCGYVCGQYEFKKLVLLRPSPCTLAPVQTPEEFVSYVGQNGMTFGLDPKALERWRQGVAESRKRKGL